jgi:hypothetical protein
MALTKEQALQATNPADSDEAREASALRLMLGAAANDIFFASRTEIERLWAIHDGHGIVQRGLDAAATAIDTVEADAHAGAIEGSAEEVTDADVVNTLDAPKVAPSPAAASPAATPVNSADTIAKLRAQLVASGQSPEA